MSKYNKQQNVVFGYLINHSKSCNTILWNIFKIDYILKYSVKIEEIAGVLFNI